MMKKLIVFLSILNCCIGLYSFQNVNAYTKENQEDILDDKKSQETDYFVEGYVFKDINHSGHMDDDEHLSNLKMNLWQENNLMDTTMTDEEGYYCFEGLEENKKYQITAECFSDCTLMQRQPNDDITNDFMIMQDYQVKTEEFVMDQTFRQYNLGLTPIAYHIEYKLNGAIGTFHQDEKAYSENATVKILSAESLSKEGYIFQGWSIEKDGSGQIYQANDTITMPSHNVKLYAIWKKDSSQGHTAQAVSVQTSTHAKAVETSDEYSLTFILLMLLSSVGGILVTKSLKKNR